MSTRAAALAFLVAACSKHPSQQQMTPDAPSQMPDAAGATFSPVPPNVWPQVGKGPGDQLSTPRILPIFFANDELQNQTEQFLAALASSSFWTTTTSEYGVGTLTIAPSIVATVAAPTTDSALQTMLVNNLTGTSPAWGAFDPNTIYAVFLPDGVTLSTNFGTSCQSFGAYHDEVTQSGAPSIVYALMPRCPGGLDQLTTAASHEFIEASTDPHPETMTAWGDHVDDAHLVWEFTPGGELGDMCEYVHAAPQRLVENFMVQRTWSNMSAAAGHDPCVPVMPTPFVVAIPAMSDALTLPDGSGGMITTMGVSIPVGGTKTIEVDLYSDAPADPFTVVPIDADMLLNGSGTELTMTLDKDTAGPGDKLMLTITRDQAGDGGGNELLVSSRVNGGSVALFWGLISN